MIAVFGVLIGDLMKDVIDEKANKLATSLPHGVSSSCRDLQRRDPGFVFNGFSGEYAFHFSTGIGTEPLSLSEIQREVITQGIVGEISGSTLWRWLSADALRPWRHRSWIFPRDPQFAEKAGRILDLYERRWNGGPLRASEFVLCADEKTSIQARCRKHSSLAPSPARPMRV